MFRLSGIRARATNPCKASVLTRWVKGLYHYIWLSTTSQLRKPFLWMLKEHANCVASLNHTVSSTGGVTCQRNIAANSDQPGSPGRYHICVKRTSKHKHLQTLVIFFTYFLVYQTKGCLKSRMIIRVSQNMFFFFSKNRLILLTRHVLW